MADSAILDFRNWQFLARGFCFVGMPFCFLVRHFAEIGQSVDELWPKVRFSTRRPNLKNSEICNPYLPIYCATFMRLR